jgi:hypothetical protein
MALALADTAVAGLVAAVEVAEQAGVVPAIAALQMLSFPHLPVVRMQTVKDLLGDSELAAAWKPVVAC